jgi:hypothetical protein
MLFSSNYTWRWERSDQDQEHPDTLDYRSHIETWQGFHRWRREECVGRCDKVLTLLLLRTDNAQKSMSTMLVMHISFLQRNLSSQMVVKHIGAIKAIISCSMGNL